MAAAEIEDHSYCEAIKHLWKNKNFMVLALSYAFMYGVYCATGSTMSNIMNPFGYTPTDISIIGGCCLATGIVGALLVGVFLDCTNWYRKTHTNISLMMIIATSLVLFLLMKNAEDGSTTLTSMVIVTAILGFASVSFFPTSLSYGAELTFPL